MGRLIECELRAGQAGCDAALTWADVRAFSSLTMTSHMFNCCLILLGHRSEWESFCFRQNLFLSHKNRQFYSAECVKQHQCSVCPGVKAFSEQGDAVGLVLLLPGGVLAVECRADGSVNMGQISQSWNTLSWKGP